MSAITAKEVDHQHCKHRNDTTKYYMATYTSWNDSQRNPNIQLLKCWQENIYLLQNISLNPLRAKNKHNYECACAVPNRLIKKQIERRFSLGHLNATREEAFRQDNVRHCATRPYDAAAEPRSTWNQITIL